MRALIAAAVVLLGCGNGGGAPPRLVLENEVDIVLVGPKIDVPFDPKSARLQEATAQLRTLVGHPITFELDSAIFSESREKFEDMVLGDVEVVASDLAKLKRNAPLAFIHGAALVQRVRLHYDATYDQREVEARFDPDARTLTVTGRGGGWSVAPGIVTAALARELDEYAARHFGPAEPDAIGPAERADYFEFLTDWRRRQKWAAAHPKPQTGPRVPRLPDAELVRKIARLAEITPHGELAGEVRKWLFDRLPEYESAYRNEGEIAAALSPDHEWRRAEVAYMGWLSAQTPTASDDERLLIARNVFTQQRDGHTPPHSFPGFDRLAFALLVIDDWAKAGHPTTMSGIEPPSRRMLMMSVVCPIGLHCDHTFYRDAIDSDAKTTRLGEALASRGDAKLVETVFTGIASLPRDDKTTALVTLARALEKDDALWRVAFRTIGDNVAQLSGATLLEEVRRVWAGEPARRPTLLYVLAWLDHHAPHTIDWEHFSTTFGAGATGADLAGMLDVEPRAMQVVHRIWPALGKGWSRTQILAPYLTAFVDGERAPGEADESIRGIAHALCAEHGAADVKELVAFFDKRRAEHPQERYVKVVSESSTCRR